MNYKSLSDVIFAICGALATVYLANWIVNG
jgi:hypothetical protein